MIIPLQKIHARPFGSLFSRFALMVLSLLLVVSLLWLTPKSTIAQEIDDALWRRDYNGFALICRSLGLEPQDDFREWRRKPASDSVAVVFGPASGMPFNPRNFVNDGGALLIASDETFRMRSPGVSFAGSGWHCSSGDALQIERNRFTDCPIVSQFDQSHPVTTGIERIATNRPGGIQKHSNNTIAIATLPFRTSSRRRFEFLAGSPANSRNPVLFCADPSVFSNQMLMYYDNARFSVMAMNWLKSGTRKNLLIVIDGEVVNPPDPKAVDVDFPAPTKDEVLDALKNLPTDKMLQFGNMLATSVEDENLANEFLATIIDDVSPKNYRRALIFLTTFLLGGFLFYRYMCSESLLQDAVGSQPPPPRYHRRSGKKRIARDRQVAAREMVSRFYRTVSAGHRHDSFEFPVGLHLNDPALQTPVWRELTKTGNDLRWKKARWWTPSRLGILESQLDYWRLLHKNGELKFVEEDQQ